MWLLYTKNEEMGFFPLYIVMHFFVSMRCVFDSSGGLVEACTTTEVWLYNKAI